MTLNVLRCTSCGWTAFPARYFCPACGGSQWREQAVECGTVTETTVVRHRIGATEGEDIHLATIATSAGPVVIARLVQPVQAGDAVRVYLDGATNRIVAHPIQASE